MNENEPFGFATLFRWVEKAILLLILLLTAGAVIVELKVVWDSRTIEIADILLLFLYTEVISMVGVFYRSHVIPVLYPIFIAMTALARLIVLQSKDMEPATILFEASAILILALAAFALRLRIGDKLVGSDETDL